MMITKNGKRYQVELVNYGKPDAHIEVNGQRVPYRFTILLGMQTHLEYAVDKYERMAGK